MKTNTTGTPKSHYRLETTPDELRTLANRLEAEKENTLPGQEVSYELNGVVKLVWEPEPKNQAAV